jgi:hypothetical protein
MLQIKIDETMFYIDESRRESVVEPNDKAIYIKEKKRRSAF